MECDEVQEQIEDLVHGFVSQAQVQVLRDHLLGCPDCGQRYRWTEKIALEIAGKATRHRLPDGLRRALEREVSGSASRRWPRPAFWVPALSLAAAVLVLALVLGKSRNPESMQVSRVVQSFVQEYQEHWFDSHSGDLQQSGEDLHHWLVKSISMEKKLPFLGNGEFRLQGARVVEISGRRGALLIYRSKETAIGFFLIPDKGIIFPVQRDGRKRILSERQGYAALTWSWSSYICSLVSKQENRQQVVGLWQAIRTASTGN